MNSYEYTLSPPSGTVVRIYTDVKKNALSNILLKV